MTTDQIAKLEQLRTMLGTIQHAQCAQWQHHAGRGRIAGISIVQHAELLLKSNADAVKLLDAVLLSAAAGVMP